VFDLFGRCLPYVVEVVLPDTLSKILSVSSVESGDKVGGHAGGEGVLPEQAGTESVDGADEAPWEIAERLSHVALLGRRGLCLSVQALSGGPQLGVEACFHLTRCFSSEGDGGTVVDGDSPADKAHHTGHECRCLSRARSGPHQEVGFGLEAR